MIDVKFVYSNPTDAIDFITADYKGDFFIETIDEGSRKEKKKAYALKSEWGAKETPFAVVMDGDKVIKAFYSEAGNVIEDLTKYLNDL